MPVFLITFAFSALLLAIFIVMFAREQSRKGARGIDHESLLPLEEETPKPVNTAEPAAKSTAKSAATLPEPAAKPTESAAPPPVPLDNPQRQP